MPRNKRLHYKDIDVLRILMALPVLLVCSMLSIKPMGDGITVEIAKASQYIAISAIDFYIFLSAFLLTSHGLREYKYRDNFRLKYYFYRRMLRILPLLVILLTFLFFIHPWIIKVLQLFEFQTPNWQHYLLGIPNYLGKFNTSQDAVLVILWFIYLMLQFYFIWGIVLKFLEKFILPISLLLIVAGIVYRYVYAFTDPFAFTFDTLAYMTPIGVGAFIASLVRKEHPLTNYIKTLKKGWIGLIYVLAFIHVICGYLFAPKFILPFVPFIGALLFSFIVLEQTYSKNSILKFRKNKFLSHLGKISFGLIVYYSIFSILIFIGIESLDFDLTSNFVKLVAIILTFALSWLTADISYHFIEQPFRNFRRDFKRE